MIQVSNPARDLRPNLLPIENPPHVETEAMAILALVRPWTPDSDARHSTDHVHCPACTAADQALEGVDIEFANLPFRDAAEYWIRLRAQSSSLRPRTQETTRQYLGALLRFFASLRLCDITPGHIRSYQLARMRNLVLSGNLELHPWHAPAGHSIINHELSVLGQMLRHCRLWTRLRPFYFPLAVPGWSPRTVLGEEEEERLWKRGARCPEARLAYLVAAITNNTTAAGIELRGLRLQHLFLPREGIAEIYIPEDAVKNNSRPRKIALNPTARWAVEECLERARRLGCCEPDHYLFPFRVRRNRYDPTRPPSRWFLRKSWEKLRQVTGFENLKPHDLRHHCITRLLENDVAPETVRAIAGHVTSKMMEYYAHQRTRVKYAAVLAIETGKKPVRSEGPSGRAQRVG